MERLKKIKEQYNKLGWKWWILLFLIPFGILYDIFRRSVKRLSGLLSSLVIKLNKFDGYLNKKLNEFVKPEES